jgi:hypothetical protein
MYKHEIHFFLASLKNFQLCEKHLFVLSEYPIQNTKFHLFSFSEHFCLTASGFEFRI